MTEAIGIPGSDLEVRSIGLALIDESPQNPRQSMEAEALDELENSIRANGVLQAIAVRPVGDRFEIIFGHRRARASKRAGLSSIPCLVLEGIDAAQALELALVENRVRRDVGIFEEAAAVAQLLELGRSRVSIAASLGISSGRVRRLSNLSTLTPEWRAAIGEALVASSWDEPTLELIALLAPEVQADLLRDFNPRNWPAPELDELRGVVRDLCRRLDRAKWKLSDSELVSGRPSCDECTQRSDVVGGLFAGIIEKGPSDSAVCRNSACWEEKAQAYVVAEYEAAKLEHGAALVLVHDKKRGGGVLNHWPLAGRPIGDLDYSEIKRPNSGEGVPAFVATGQRQCRVIRIRIEHEHSQRAGEDGRQLRGAAKPEPGTRDDLAHRRAHLANRRAAWIVDTVRDRLEAFLDAEDDAPTDFELDAREVLSLAATFGCDQAFADYFKSAGSLESLAGRFAIECIAATQPARLRRFGFNRLDELLKNALRLAPPFLKLDSHDLWAQATEAIASPKALENLEKKLAKSDPPE